jgi:vacuolar-type H+-ATPase catalytic subunit A/Vma1|tara:strand:- start:206 stop:640 length:435 start_codon:yes stop_codon:yes gene_type:complete
MSEPNMFSKHDMYTQIELLKKEVQDMKGIYQRLDTAIVKIGDVSNSINRMLAVHEEKISQQEDVLIRSDAEFSANVKELHSRITTNTKEMMALMSEQHKEQTDAMTKLKTELQGRVGVLEKWRWLIIGGSIVVGFIAQKMIILS